MTDVEQERHARLFGDCSPVLLAKFKTWHYENLHVFNLFVKFAREARAAGRKRFSGWMIANRIRWYTTIETRGDDYKISNDYIALLVRLTIWKHPEFEGFFYTKAMKPDRGFYHETKH